MVSPLEDCMETSVKVKLKSQEKRKAIKLVPQKQTAEKDGKKLKATVVDNTFGAAQGATTLP